MKYPNSFQYLFCVTNCFTTYFPEQSSEFIRVMVVVFVLVWPLIRRLLALLDSPGIIPTRISDELAAIQLGICNHVSAKSYNYIDVAGKVIHCT